MYSLFLKFSRKLKIAFSLLMVLLIPVFTLADTENNDQCSEVEQISEMHNQTGSYSRTETGTVSNNDDDYYYFTIPESGVLTVTYTSTANTDLRIVAGVACDSNINRVLNNGTSYSGTLNITAGQTVYVRIQRRNGTPNYSLGLSFVANLPTISIADASKVEGNSGYSDMNFSVTISQSANATVNFTTSNATATAVSDYNTTSGTLTFTSGGATSKTISVPIVGDLTIESTETFNVILSSPSGATLSDANATGTIINDDIQLSYCDDNNLTTGFHIANPFNDANKSIEIYCYNNKDYIALPIKNNSNNFVFNNNVLTSTHYYNQARDNANHFDAIEINAYTLKVETNSSIRLPQTIGAPTSFQTMGSSFSNINLTGTPFAIDWANTTISNCTQAKLRTAYYGQDVKINTLNYDAKAICNIDSMKLKLLDNYRYLEYEGSEVLRKSCKTMAEAVPTSFLDSSSIQGHYWISPFSNARSYNRTNIKSDNRPIIAYCWYQTDLDWVWTFALAMDGKVTNSKNDLVNKSDTCSEFGLFPFVANKEDTFERVRQFLYNNKSQWENYTGTINEKISLFTGGSYYLGTEQSSIIWPYGSFGVYFPYGGNRDSANAARSWYPGSSSTPGWMSGSPMHNISTITTDYGHVTNDEGNANRDYYDWGTNYIEGSITNAQTLYSNIDTTYADGAYPYGATMGAKGWKSILSDLNKTNEWFISRTGAGVNFDHSSAAHPYYEPNGNYTANAWLNFLFDSNGRVRHNDDWDANYAYYDYMCMADDNYDFTTRYGLLVGPFKAIEHGVASGSEATSTAITTKIVNDTIRLDIAILNDALTALAPDKNVSVGIFMNDTYMVGSTETARDIHYFGDIKLNATGSFNDDLNSTGRFELPAASWPSGAQTWGSATKRLFVKFKYCSRTDYEWTQCWTLLSNSAVCTTGQEAYCKSVDSNDFAVRPNNFDFSITGTSPYKAGANYPVTFSAQDFGGTNTPGYNESVPLTYIETRPGCITGAYVPAYPTITFVEGAQSTTLAYNEVGVINVKIQETAGTEFAAIDASDTSALQRLITPYDQNWSYTPDHFSFIGSTFENNASGFTYLSNDLSMAANLNLTIVAQNLSNATTANYNSACYAKTTTYTLAYSTPLTISPSTALSQIRILDTNTSVTTNLPINNAWSIVNAPNTIFSTDNNGTGKINLKVNFDRNSTRVVNPFNFTMRDINVTDFDTVQGGRDLNQTAMFYYGRVYAPDYRGENDITAPIYYEVYCRNCNRADFNITGAESVNTLDWFANAMHDTNVPGQVNQFNSLGATNFPTAGTAVSGAIANGIETQTLRHPTPPAVDRITMTPSGNWLIYNQFNPAATTNDFLVEFTTGATNWAGQGTLGHTIDDTNTSVSKKSNRRIEW